MYGHVYTVEEKEFMKQYVPGHSHKEIQQEFTAGFGWLISLQQVKGYIANNKLNTGRNGRYEKGNVPMNKGRKGYCAPGSEKGWFKKGQPPIKHRSVGSERISKDGYIEIKTAEPSKWELKHRVVWKKYNGEIPKGHIVGFRDGNKTNTDISNLVLISRSAHAVMNHTDLHEFTGELKDTAVYLAELKVSHEKAKRRNRK